MTEWVKGYYRHTVVDGKRILCVLPSVYFEFAVDHAFAVGCLFSPNHGIPRAAALELINLWNFTATKVYVGGGSHATYTFELKEEEKPVVGRWVKQYTRKTMHKGDVLLILTFTFTERDATTVGCPYDETKGIPYDAAIKLIGSWNYTGARPRKDGVYYNFELKEEEKPVEEYIKHCIRTIYENGSLHQRRVIEFTEYHANEVGCPFNRGLPRSKAQELVDKWNQSGKWQGLTVEFTLPAPAAQPATNGVQAAQNTAEYIHETALDIARCAIELRGATTDDAVRVILDDLDEDIGALIRYQKKLKSK